MVILVMLDLLAAFETLDHSIMLSRLRDMYGIQGDALECIRSYLDLRSQCVKLLGTESANKILTFAMPQGFVLGAEFNCYYSKPVGKIILYHDMEYLCYADDSKLYLIIKQSDIPSTISHVEHCVSDIKRWMGTNLLKPNEDKMEVILFASPKKQHILANISLHFGDCTITPQKVKNLGCWWNNTLSMSDHATTTAQTCFHQLRKIQHIRKFLSLPALKSITQSLVIS